MTQKDLILKEDIAIEHGKIVSIGEVDPSFVPDKVIDATDALVLPSFVNAHSHISMTYFRNYSDQVDSLQDWLSAVWALEDTLKEEDIYPASLLAIVEMIQSGITTFSDMYFFPQGTVEAMKEAKVKGSIGLTLFGDEKETQKRLNSNLPYLVDIRNQSKNQILFDIAPHSVYTCSEGTYKMGSEAAKDVGCALHTHVSETLHEVNQSIATFGLSPVKYLEKLGVFEGSCYLAHGVHVSDEDIEVLAQYKIPIIHNPSSNAKLACGIAPVTSFLEHSIPVALGTDGPASNNSLDMFLELRLASFLASLKSMKPHAITPYQLLRMATIEGAKALGREKECGTLEVGKDADIILVDTTSTHMNPHNDYYSSLIFSAKSSDVKTVLCKGEVLMENRQIPHIDLERLLDQVNSQWEHIKKR